MIELRYQIEEIESIWREKTAFLAEKERKRTISVEEANLFRFRLDRIVAIGKTLRALQAAEQSAPVAPIAPKEDARRTPVGDDDGF